jgi:predicted DNA binding protein
MAVIAKVSIPADALRLGRLFQEHPGVTVEFERTVPIEKGGRSLFWTRQTDPDAVESTIRGWDVIDYTTVLSDGNGEGLMEVAWRDGPEEFAHLVDDEDFRLLDVVGADGTWQLTTWFSSRNDLVRFNEMLTGAGLRVTLEKVQNAPMSQGSSLSSEQRQAVSLAYRRGFFEVPRKHTKQELAEEAGISDTAFSQRLRRGIAACIEEALDGSTLLRES